MPLQIQISCKIQASVHKVPRKKEDIYTNSGDPLDKA